MALYILDVLCLDEENHIHELSAEVSHLQTIVQKQREEMRTLEHDVSKKNAELEVVSFDDASFIPLHVLLICFMLERLSFFRKFVLINLWWWWRWSL